jgi:signal peptidase II
MPVKRREIQAVISVVAILLIFALDQHLKKIVYLKLSIGESIPIIKNILHVTFVTNTGAAFGLFKDNTFVFIIISLIAILITSIFMFLSIKKGEFLSKPFFNLGLILITSGALGNLIDRLKFGYVVDFIDVRIWPVFNVADSSITIGTFLLILSSIVSHNKSKVTKQALQELPH